MELNDVVHLVSRMIEKTVAPVWRQMRLIAGRAVIKLVDDTLKEQVVQVQMLSGEVGNAERYQHYGFTSVPHPQAESVFLSLGACRGHLVIVADGDRRYRLKGLADGEVALHDDQGQAIHLKRDKTVHVYGTDHLVADVGVDTTVTCPLVTVTASTKVMLQTPLVECSQNMKVGGSLEVAQNAQVGGGLTMTASAGTGLIQTPGNIQDAGGTMAAIRTVYNAHTHTGDEGTTTSTPHQTM